MADGYQIRNQNAMHFLTLSTVGWIDIFTSGYCRQCLIRNLTYCQKNKGLVIFAYVIMSNHIHIICRASDGYLLSNVIRDFKSYTAKQILKLLQDKKDKRIGWMFEALKFYARFNKRNAYQQVWQQNNHPIELVSPNFINQKIDYIHNNPVRAGIVENYEDYICSSARNYAGKAGLINVEMLDLSNDIGFIPM